MLPSHGLFHRLTVKDALVQTNYPFCITVCKVKEELVYATEFSYVVEKPNA